ncbi:MULTISPECIES: IclR family transcriptional regulator [Bordetella]|uniref:IclR family transcriptional regulator n=1 Tax=Bordetella genomosp. 6 TaxID=463024 RepID=A0ABX4FIN4_9BORD|nr:MULTISPECIES: IclR family transcriptional regulator [Bordetella]AOB28949.1 IclR family transcriptional regulator [Bordetella bronchiseptica]ARP74705.1 IclR family transcriptional regulator [Bordetella genomosp. 6]AZW46306.1 IclR family transcriptional regulator [Bordetella bronchiseptica]KCV59141.1 transcriptional regulator, IclR family, C-terminal domain protein [Bordetella bronchiseptica 99-R-0433]MBN3267201.1 IclR family transcriptional regulator [Bordetella bronchiseptica]
MDQLIDAMETTDRQFATTLQRGLLVLACFDVRQPFLTNKEISARTGIPSPTVSRLTYTLTLMGYLKHHRHLGKYGKYELGNAVLSLAHPLLANVNVRQVARVPMRELADYAHGWVSLGARERLSMVYLETARARNALDVKPDIGQTFPMLVSAMGRAYLAASQPSERERLMNQLRIYHPELMAEQAEELEHSRADYAAHGFCLSRGDYDRGTWAVAVPMRVPESQELLVFNCAVRVRNRQADELSPHLIDVVGPRLLDMVDAIRRALED